MIVPPAFKFISDAGDLNCSSDAVTIATGDEGLGITSIGEIFYNRFRESIHLCEMQDKIILKMCKFSKTRACVTLKLNPMKMAAS